MKTVHLVYHASGPLLALSGIAAAQGQSQLEVSQIIKSTEPREGGFRTFMEFAVGGQKMLGLLDTGSSDLTVPQTGSQFCQSPGQQCDGKSTGFVFGSFDPNRSSGQVQKLNQPLNATFTGGAGFTGEFIAAPLQVAPGGKVFQQQMGLVNGGGVPKGQVSFPVIGVGPVGGESARQKYPNIPERAKQEQISTANAFGLFLGDFRNANNGTIVWGGFDAAKFTGELKTAPLLPTKNGQLPSFVVGFSSVRLASSGGGQVGPGSQVGPGGPGGPSRPGAGGPGQSGNGGNGGRGGIGGNGGTSRVSQSELTTQAAQSDQDAPAAKYGNPYAHHRDYSTMQLGTYDNPAKHLSARALRRRQSNGNLLSNELPPVVLLDTGNPAILLPLKTVEALGQSLGGRPGPQGEFLVDCQRIKGVDAVFGMNNDTVQIRVPLETMIEPTEKTKNQNNPLPKVNGPQNGNGGGDNNNIDNNNNNNNNNNNIGDEDVIEEVLDNLLGLGNDLQSRTLLPSHQILKGKGNQVANNGGGGGSSGIDNGKGQSGKGVGGNGGGGGVGGGNGGECQLTIGVEDARGPSGINVLGSPVMQHMYILFDIDCKALHIAQSKNDETRSDLKQYVPNCKASP